MPAISHARRGPFLGSRPMAVRAPTGIGWTPSWYVREWKPGLFSTSINPASLKLATTNVRYVDLATGNNGNTGLVKASPKKSIWHAINVGASDTIYIKGSANPATPTVYPYDDGWRLPSLANSNMIAVSDFDTRAPGYVISSSGNVAGDSLLGAWASVGGGTPDTYAATLAAAPYGVVDGAFFATGGGSFSRLTLRSSIATVDANPGSYWHNAGSLYVRTADSRAPDVKVRALKSAINGHESVAISIYVERIAFEGGNARCFYLQNIVGATFVDCALHDGQAAGLELSTVAAAATHTVTLIRCRGFGNAGDGLGATAGGAGTVVNWLEVDCDGTGNTSAGGTDQGSSLHKTVGNGAFVGVRVGGTYHGNKTDGIADVGAMQTWCLGSRIYGEAIGAVLGGAGTMWLHGCSVVGSTGTADLVTDDAGGTIYTASTTYRTTSGAGTVTSYTP